MDCDWMDLVPRLDGEPDHSVALVEALGDVDGALPHPHSEPVEEVARTVDWSTLQINEINDECEGRLESIENEHMYELLGLRDEEEKARKAAGAAAKHADKENVPAQTIADASLPVDDCIPGERVIVYDPDKPSMSIGSVYPCMKEFRLAMRQFAINEEFELDLHKTDPTRYIANCKAEDYPWHIVGRRQPDKKTIMVTVLIDEHTCMSSSRRRTTTPTSAWVASKAVKILRKNPMSTKDLLLRLQDDHKCEIHYDTVWAGRNKAMDELYGTWEDSFKLLYRWKEEVLAVTSPCIEGFKDGCRPYLSIDSTALNGRWNGHLAAATALDGHNWMYPVAFGFIDSETKDNWTWFMEMLHKAIGDMPTLAVCTDACKGLETAVKTVFPRAEQRECFRHLMENYIKKFGGDTHSKMYPAARAYRVEVFKQHLKPIIDASTEVFEWLQRNHSLLWMRCGFNPDIKCDYITNNLAECFNNWIKDIKDLPVCELADKLREMIMVLWNKRRLIGEAHQNNDINLEDYVHEYYSVEKFQNAYKRLIEPLPDKSYWPYVDLPFEVAAPLVPRGVGRQRTERIKSFLEGGGSKSKKKSVGKSTETEKGDDNVKGKKQMIRGKRQCSRCGELGHGESSYKCALNGTKKRKRKPRKNATKELGKKPVKKKAKNNAETIMQNSPIQNDKKPTCYATWRRNIFAANHGSHFTQQERAARAAHTSKETDT